MPASRQTETLSSITPSWVSALQCDVIKTKSVAVDTYLCVCTTCLHVSFVSVFVY